MDWFSYQCLLFFLSRKEALQVSRTEEVQSSSNNVPGVAAYPSSLVMVKTTSGKNVILKVVPQHGIANVSIQQLLTRIDPMSPKSSS